ncbi:MAG: glycosyltransferase [Candidatus Limnocylindrales bacterium]
MTRSAGDRAPMTRPPIAYVLKMYPRLSETFILNEILELERQGQPVHIFSLRPSDDARHHADVTRVRARVTTVPQQTWRLSRPMLRAHLELLGSERSRYLGRLWKTLRQRRARAIESFNQAVLVAGSVRRLGAGHVHAHFASTATSVAREVHRLTLVGYSFTAHAKDIFADDVRPDDLHRKLEDATFAVTVSDFNVAFLTRITPSARVVRIYNGLDLRSFSANGRRLAQPPRVLAVGRLIEKKGFSDLIAACSTLRQQGRRFQCEIVGTGALGPELAAQIATLGLEDIVRMTGALPREEVIERYREAAVMVAPCVVGKDGNRDGLPTVLTEALALTVPVVATDVTGIPELVRHGETGTIVAQHDAAALAEAIARTLDDPASTARRVEAGRALVEQEFDLERNVAQLLREFHGAMA